MYRITTGITATKSTFNKDYSNSKIITQLLHFLNITPNQYK
jgi:hypothetical protein